MGRRRMDLTGETFGHWTVLQEEQRGNSRRWLCRCTCGKTKEVSQGMLRNGRSRSCGCGCLERKNAKKPKEKKQRKRMDLTGKTYGRLLVMREASMRGRYRYWVCQCACGQTKEILQSRLRNGEIRSCGCASRMDITGHVYGKLTVLAEEEKRGQLRYWRCRSACGEVLIIDMMRLRNGSKTSCGCDKRRKRRIKEQPKRERLTKSTFSIGARGVYFNKETRMWDVYVMLDGKRRRYVGEFDSLREAIEQRNVAEEAYRTFEEA